MKYKEILDGQFEQKDVESEQRGLAVIKQQTSLALSNVTNVDELAKVAGNVLPQVVKQQLMTFDGLDEDLKPVWGRLVHEGLAAGEALPKRRTVSEKKMAVLQANRFPTAAAKFHQAQLEQGVWMYKAVDARKNYERKKIELEKMLYRYRQKESKLVQLQQEGKDTFIREKNLELMRIDLLDKLQEINHLKDEINNVAHEVQEWSALKEELYNQANEAGEFWSPDFIDENGAQEVPLVIRHLDNYLTAVQYGGQTGNNTSDMLNISGLASTALKEGQKNNRLGVYLNHFSDEQIAVLWKNIFGLDIKVIRQNNIMFLLLYKDINQPESFLGNLSYPTTMEAFNNWDKIVEDFQKQVQDKPPSA